jgi:hypothetical protein
MRVSEKMLIELAQTINKVSGTPMTYCDKTTASPHPSHIGHYYIDMAYGGYKLVQLTNEHGGIREITYGFTTKRELFNQMQALLYGIQSQLEFNKCVK